LDESFIKTCDVLGETLRKEELITAYRVDWNEDRTSYYLVAGVRSSNIPTLAKKQEIEKMTLDIDDGQLK